MITVTTAITPISSLPEEMTDMDQSACAWPCAQARRETWSVPGGVLIIFESHRVAAGERGAHAQKAGACSVPFCRTLVPPTRTFGRLRRALQVLV